MGTDHDLDPTTGYCVNCGGLDGACVPSTDDSGSAEDRAARMEEALCRIAEWADAYPVSVFPEPDDAYYKRAHEVLTANGMTLDRLSAAAMWHVVAGVGKIAKAALS